MATKITPELIDVFVNQNISASFPKIVKLIRLAQDESTSLEERRTAALTAIDFMKATNFLDNLEHHLKAYISTIFWLHDNKKALRQRGVNI